MKHLTNVVPKTCQNQYVEQFVTKHIHCSNDVTIYTKYSGSGPPVLLLHGFPETHHMWRNIAPALARRYTVVMADLRGYGNSSCPPSTDDHTPYSKRIMAQDMIQVMQQLGFSTFAVVGHDRGARVAYRLALDHPEVVTHLAVLDILPTGLVWEKADAKMMIGYWPWNLLAQPAPLPEHILQATAKEIVDNACNSWGSAADTFSAETRKIYAAVLQDAAHCQAICEEYRAAASIDRTHDQTDLKNGHQISCPTLVLWGAKGPLDTWYQEDGGPLALWRSSFAPLAQGAPIEGGHFFAEQAPEALYKKLTSFLAASFH